MGVANEILSKVRSVRIPEQAVADAIVACSPPPDVLEMMEDERRDRLVDGASGILIAVNLAQTLAVDYQCFEETILGMELRGDDERVNAFQLQMLDQLTSVAMNEPLSRSMFKPALQGRIACIRSAIEGR